MEEVSDVYDDFTSGKEETKFLSDKFKKDVEFHLGDLESRPINIDYPKEDAPCCYIPDHGIGEGSDDESSTGASFKDPLDDETSSIVSNLERVAMDHSEDSDVWDGSSHIIWTSQEMHRSNTELNKTKTMISSVLSAINRDSGSTYRLNLTRPSTLFITKDDSMTISRRRASKKAVRLVDEELYNQILEKFQKGIKLNDLDEKGEYIIITENTSGFDPTGLKEAVSQGKKSIKEVLEFVFRKSGKWGYMAGSYDIDKIQLN